MQSFIDAHPFMFTILAFPVVVLLNRAAARFDLVCGLEDVQFTKTRD